MITEIQHDHDEIGLPEKAKQLMAKRQEDTLEAIEQLRNSSATCDINGILHNMTLVDHNLSGDIVLNGFPPEQAESINTWLRRSNDLISDSYRQALADVLFRMADMGCRCESKD